MENFEQEPASTQEDSFHILWKNPNTVQKVVHSLMGGKHIDPYLAEEFRFLESHPTAWEDFFSWLGYRLKRSELGGSPFFYLIPRTETIIQSRLSRGATFLGLYLAWYFFMQGPGESDRIDSEEIFRRLVNSYSFNQLRFVFIRNAGNLNPMELSEDQAEKMRGYIRRELQELAKYRFIDLKPSIRSNWENLTVHRLPALYRFWELALHVHGNNGSAKEADIDQVVAQVWGRVDLEPEDDDR